MAEKKIKIADKESEITILQCCIHNEDHLLQACQDLLTDHFFFLENREIFRIIKKLYLNNESVTIDNIIMESRNVGSLADLSEVLPSIKYRTSEASFETAFRVIKENYILGNIIELNKKLEIDIQKREIGDNTIVKILQECQTYLYNQEQTLNDSFSSLFNEDFYGYKNVEEFLKDRMEKFKEGQTISGLSTGFPSIDEAINGLNGPDYVILAGTPGSGKTQMSLQMMLYITTVLNKKVGFISLEMIKEQVGLRMLAYYNTGLTPKQILQGDIPNDQEYKELIQVVKTLENNKNLFLQTKHIHSTAMLYSRIKALVEVNEIDLLVIDYATLVQNHSSDKNSTEAYAEISTTIREALKDFKIPGLILAQLNRKATDISNEPPEKHHIYGSSQFERDASCILMLHSYKDSLNRTLYIRKNRIGALTQLPFHMKKGVLHEGNLTLMQQVEGK